MDIQSGVSDPNGTSFPNQSAGGAKKISSTDHGMDGTSGYGFMTNDASMKAEGMAGETTLPKASPITIVTDGDPNCTASC